SSIDTPRPKRCSTARRIAAVSRETCAEPAAGTSAATAPSRQPTSSGRDQAAADTRTLAGPAPPAPSRLRSSRPAAQTERSRRISRFMCRVPSNAGRSRKNLQLSGRNVHFETLADGAQPDHEPVTLPSPHHDPLHVLERAVDDTHAIPDADVGDRLH